MAAPPTLPLCSKCSPPSARRVAAPRVGADLESPRRRYMGCFFPSKKQIEHDGKLPAPRPVVHATPAPAPAPVMQNNDAAGEGSLGALLAAFADNDMPLSSPHAAPGSVILSRAACCTASSLRQSHTVNEKKL